MDAVHDNSENFAVNFDLLTDDFELVEAGKNVGSSENIPESIVDLLDSINASNLVQNDDDYKAFEEDTQKQRFKVVTEQDLDTLASETNAISTHWQTNWAVNVLRGTYQHLSLKYFI